MKLVSQRMKFFPIFRMIARIYDSANFLFAKARQCLFYALNVTKQDNLHQPPMVAAKSSSNKAIFFKTRFVRLRCCKPLRITAVVYLNER